MEKESCSTEAVEKMDAHEDSSNDMETDSDSDDSCTSGESTVMDEDECERRRENYMRELIELERQFQDLKERYCQERLTLVDAQLQQVRCGTAAEYLSKLTALEENWRTRNDVADILRQLQLSQVERIYDGELCANEKDYENAKRLAFDLQLEDIENRIAKLENDKRSADISLELWYKDNNKPKSSPILGEHGKSGCTEQQLSPEKRKKPITISGPCIVYMLTDNDIFEDWNIIRRAALQTELNESQVNA